MLQYKNLNWSKISQEVWSMQNKIAVAYLKGDSVEIIRLQRILVRSFEARALAVRRVTTNQGKNTTGIDNVIWNTDILKIEAIIILKDLQNYKSSPVRRIYIPKEETQEIRPLGILTIFDRAVQALFYIALLPISETRSDIRSYGFRPYKSVHDAVKYLWYLLAHPTGYYRWILESDVEKCFDKISHEWLLKHVPLNKTILNEFLKCGVWENGQITETVEGTPQGGIISPILINYTLDGLEKIIPDKIKIVRYADDLVVLANSKEELEEIIPKINEFLEERGLRLKPSKTKLIEISTGFDFLGFNFREYPSLRQRISGRKQGTLLITPSKIKKVKFREKIRNLIKHSHTITSGKLITLLNPILRGWANYYKHVVSSHVFSSISNYIWYLLWNWIRRKHGYKSNKWRYDKYFMRRGGVKWIFKGKNEKGNLITLFQINQTKITRHILRKDINIFLDEKEIILSSLNHNLGLNEFKSKLWKRQKGICPICEMSLMDEHETLEIHHIIPKRIKLDNRLKNLVLLHKECHKQVTNSKDNKLRAVWKSKGLIP